ncbi:MAG: hypothetical protein RLZZ499_3410 [Cyanobacteriota bacterium]|jgi:hypothetical protein
MNDSPAENRKKNLAFKSSNYLDKETWGPGEWQTEPDLATWIDPGTGYRAIVQRHEVFGTLNGYVGVDQNHPWYQVMFDSPLRSGGRIDTLIAVYGDLTFSGYRSCDLLEASPEELWYFGFDTAHCFDLCPSPLLSPNVSVSTEVNNYIVEMDPRRDSDPYPRTYKNFKFLSEQLASLARQLKAVEDVPNAFALSNLNN